MMRSMFSGVSGLRIHQTKMDVIANNISNVNTVGFKSSRVTFAEIFSQTISGASAANESTGRGGVNPMQIGLGGTVASIDLHMTIGAAQRTDNPFDLMIQGDGFFIIGDNSGKYFTRAGVFNLDESSNLVAPNGMIVYGWDRRWNEDDAVWEVNKTGLTPISITGDKQSSPPSSTTKVEFDGNLNAVTDPVHKASMSFYDTVGNRYVAEVTFYYDKYYNSLDYSRWTYHISDVAYLNGEYDKPVSIEYLDPTSIVPYPGNILEDGVLLYNTNGKLESGNIAEIQVKPVEPTPALITAAIDALNGPPVGGTPIVPPAPAAAAYTPTYVLPTGGFTQALTAANTQLQLAREELKNRENPTPPAVVVPSDVAFQKSYIAMLIEYRDKLQDLKNEATARVKALTESSGYLDPRAEFGGYNNILRIDFTELTQYGSLQTNGKSNMADGKAPGNLIGVSIGTDGKVTGRYSNGMMELLAQIPVAQFRNPAGLEKIGDNLYVPTPNSGEFDGIGEEVQASGGKIMGGVLEMSNVDLAQEFTEMITTQRGFQANSRVITVSDDMLQELVNLKR